MMYIVYKQIYGAKPKDFDYKVIIGEDNLLPYSTGYVILRVDKTTKMGITVDIHAL